MRNKRYIQHPPRTEQLRARGQKQLCTELCFFAAHNTNCWCFGSRVGTSSPLHRLSLKTHVFCAVRAHPQLHSIPTPRFLYCSLLENKPPPPLPRRGGITALVSWGKEPTGPMLLIRILQKPSWFPLYITALRHT